MPISLTSGEDEGLRPALKPRVMEKPLQLQHQFRIRLTSNTERAGWEPKDGLEVLQDSCFPTPAPDDSWKQNQGYIIWFWEQNHFSWQAGSLKHAHNPRLRPCESLRMSRAEAAAFPSLTARSLPHLEPPSAPNKTSPAILQALLPWFN